MLLPTSNSKKSVENLILLYKVIKDFGSYSFQQGWRILEWELIGVYLYIEAIIRQPRSKKRVANHLRANQICQFAGIRK